MFGGDSDDNEKVDSTSDVAWKFSHLEGINFEMIHPIIIPNEMEHAKFNIDPNFDEHHHRHDDDDDDDNASLPD